MKNYYLLLCLLFVFNVSFAQSITHPDHSDEAKEKMMLTEIKVKFYKIEFSDLQMDSLIAIQVEAMEYLNNVYFLSGGQFMANQEEFIARAMDAEKRMLAVLTDLQKLKHNAYEEERKVAHEAIKEFRTENREGFRANSKKVNAYKKEVINPVIKKQRLKLEELISEQDLNEIAKIKSEEKLNRKAISSLYRQFQQSLDETEKVENSTEYIRLSELQSTFIKRKYELSRKYRNEITMVMDEIKSQRKDWFEWNLNEDQLLHENNPLRKFNEEHFWLEKIDQKTIYSDKYDHPGFHDRFIMMDILMD